MFKRSAHFFLHKPISHFDLVRERDFRSLLKGWFNRPIEIKEARAKLAIWEIYKPASKRTYGPYTMPVLYLDQLVARMDAKPERHSRTLLIHGLWLENWFVPDHAFVMALANGLLRFAVFLGVKHLDTTTISSPISQAVAFLSRWIS